MTLSPWTIYIWGLADPFRFFCIGIGILWFFAVAFQTAEVADEKWKFKKDGETDDDVMARAWTDFRNKSAKCSLFFLAAVLIPSSKTVAMMVVLPAIVNSEPIQKDLPEVYHMAVDALKDYLTPEKK